MKGVNLKITTDHLNTILGIIDIPEQDLKKLADNEIFSILRPGEPIGPLKFKPADMNDIFRVIWYLYNWNMVQKG